jgi:hypothetical protein
MVPRTGLTTALPLVGLLALLSGPALAENVDPAEDGSQYAWAENTGWINAEPLGDGGPGMQVGDFALTGWLWGENIGWISLSCENRGSCGSVDYRVTNNGDGVLGGFAWSENAGWISFSCANTASCSTASYGVVIDPFNGEFSGRAWGENLGWVSFASTGPHPYRVKTGWTCSVPAGSPTVSVSRLGPETLVSWSEGWASCDVIRGGLALLRSGGFTAATQTCLADDDPGTSLTHNDTPAPGDGFWFLARAANCGGGTWDSGGPGQVGPRDAPIEASGNGCP